jgi:hypothetical protein
LEWSAGRFDQAVARLHRIGQANTVVVTPIIAKNIPLENAMIGTYKRKKRNIAKLLDNDIVETPKTQQETFMSIEQSLERIATALEGHIKNFQNVGAMTGPLKAPKGIDDVEVEKPKAKSPGRPSKEVKAATKSPPASEHTEATVRKLMMEVLRAHPEGKEEGREAIKDVVKTVGYESFDDMPTEDYDEFVACLKRLKGTFVPDADESDDDLADV